MIRIPSEGPNELAMSRRCDFESNGKNVANFRSAESVLTIVEFTERFDSVNRTTNTRLIGYHYELKHKKKRSKRCIECLQFANIIFDSGTFRMWFARPAKSESHPLIFAHFQYCGAKSASRYRQWVTRQLHFGIGFRTFDQKKLCHAAGEARSGLIVLKTGLHQRRSP